MRTALLALPIFVSCLLNAQSWCPPGATWTYGTDAFGYYGYQQYSYVGDTALGGLTGQRIAGQGAMSYFGQTQVDHWSNPLSFITAMDSDVVMIWSDPGQGWDTLFWMGAAPGDGWLRPTGLYGACDPNDSLVVIDTTMVVFDGLPLKRWEVQQRWAGGNTWSLFFTERIGWDWNFAPYPACLIIDGPIGLRCYSDQDISVSFFNFGCESLVGMGEDRHEASYQIFPNPGTDQFTMSLLPGTHTVTLFDATGRTVLQQSSSGDRVTFDTAPLPSGIYVVRVDDDVRPLRWVKE